MWISIPGLSVQESGGVFNRRQDNTKNNFQRPALRTLQGKLL